MSSRLVAFVAAAVFFSLTAAASALGPFGSIRVGPWKGGAYTDDSNGAFSVCGVSASYANGIELAIGQNAAGYWILGFVNSKWRKRPGESISVNLTFDGQSQLHLFATAATQIFINVIVPRGSAIDHIRRSHMMAAVIGGQVYQFELRSTRELLSTLAYCVEHTKRVGVKRVGVFAVPAVDHGDSSGASEPKAAMQPAGVTPGPSAPKEAEVNGTGFAVSKTGHIVTNNHVIHGCVGSIYGTLPGGSRMTLRVVSTDETNDLALLQAPTTFEDIATLRATGIHSGDAIVAIGYPYHGLLSSDFTVTTGIVSSLSGVLNDSRYLQISAPVQPGNSGGPLFDMSGDVVGIVAEKLNALKFAKLTGGNLPENINFAIKIGGLRDFLDNSVVAYRTAAPGAELKTADIASNARPFTMLISCTARVKE